MASGRKDPDALSLFADELKAHRTGRGWTQADVAAKASYSESLIAQVETCRRAATRDLAKALDRVFDTPGWSEDTPDSAGTPGTFGRLVTKLRNLPFPPSFRSFAPYEKDSTALYIFEHSLIPGIFQTPEYARAVLEMNPNTTDEEVNERVAARLARQAILEREDPPAPVLWVLLDQNVLIREVGGAKAMRDQLTHLVRMARSPNITIQVIPNVGAHPGLLGAFTIAELDGSSSIVHLEDIADGRVAEDAATVPLVTLRFHSLRSEALPKAASRTMIESEIERWKEPAS